MEVITGIVGELRQIARSEAIIGEPVTVGDKTVIPIVKVSVGFGAGGGEGEQDKKGGGYGAGGGGGCTIEPAAFIIMDEKGIHLLPVKPGKIDAIIDAIPTAFKKISGLKDKFDLGGDKGKGKSKGKGKGKDSSDDTEE